MKQIDTRIERFVREQVQAQACTLMFTSAFVAFAATSAYYDPTRRTISSVILVVAAIANVIFFRWYLRADIEKVRAIAGTVNESVDWKLARVYFARAEMLREFILTTATGPPRERLKTAIDYAYATIMGNVYHMDQEEAEKFTARLEVTDLGIRFTMRAGPKILVQFLGHDCPGGGDKNDWLTEVTE